jgi:hypothetical protein
MDPKTIENLCAVEVAIEKLKVLLTQQCYQGSLRTAILAATIDQLIEHHDATLLLIRSSKVGSAFALSRSIVEGMYRGLWLNFCATDEQVQTFEKEDKLPLNMTEMATAIDERYRGEGFFEDLKKRTWPQLCSYAHTGMLQLGRRFTGQELKPAYTDREIYEVTTTVTTAILTLSSKFLAVQNRPEASKEAERLIETFGPVSEPGVPTSAPATAY